MAALFVLVQTVFIVQAKPIRLRGETIETDSGANRAAMAGQKKAKAIVSGLFLIQFNGPLEAAQREELKKTGVTLIKYVPDDAFIAKLDKVSPATVSALSYVRWVGPYKSEHKIQPQIAAHKQSSKTNVTVSVNILLAPNATASEITAVRGQLRSAQPESHLRLGTIVRGELSTAQLDTLAASGAVLWIERAHKRKLVDEAAAKIVGGDDGLVATRTVTQQLGFDGSGVTVCVADTGLDTGNTNTMHPDLFGRITGFKFYGSFSDASDGYGHGTHCAGIVAGNAASGETDPDSQQFYGLGVAPGAKLFVERVFGDDGSEANPFPSDETMTRDAVRGGAKIGSNSWGSETGGEYDTDCAQFDELVRDADAGTAGYQPYILEFSAGNSGPNSQTINSPASAKNVIATGASQNVPGTLASTYGLYADGIDTMADFSSRGPCADGRIKPDVVAPGTWIASAASSFALDPAGTSWTVIDDLYVYMGGTSMAGPHCAGAAAVFVQFYKFTHTNAIPSPALTKAALINSADELDQGNGGPEPVPNNDEGWGRITLENIINTNFATAPRAFDYVDQTTLLTNGQIFTRHIFVRGAGEPLKVTLAYTDVPGFPGALPALVNDLDLEVIAPDGTLYRGNQFGAGESVPNAPSADKLNNVEGVFLSAPTAGDYQVRVRATKIVSDALTNSAAIDQDFALVTSGDLARPGAGIILLDRPSYTAPSTMNLLVLDAARAASNSVNVIITNLALHTGLTKTLNAQGNYGAFTGVVTTVTGTANAGQIQIANGNPLEARYIDAGNNLRTATAIADLTAPVITGVSTSTDLGVLTVTWTTSEPATSLVRYGTNNANLNLAVTNNSLVTSHVVKLTRLIPGRTYYFSVSSADAASNGTTNNNSGAYFTFTGIATPTVLLVDAYDTAAEEANGATVIADSTYTNVLSAAGISYGFWKVNLRGSPQLADLKPFPVVIWRTTDDTINYGVDADGLVDPTATNNTLNAQQQFMLQNYLNGGGSFFMASMGVLSQLGEVPFRRNILQIAGYKPNPSPPAPCDECDEDFGVAGISGASGALAGGINLTLNYANYPFFDFDGIVYGPDFSDTFTPSALATAISFETNGFKPCGLSYPNVGVDSPGRVVFLGFPFDTVPTNGAGTNNAVALMKNVIQFLAPGVNGAAVVRLDRTAYTTNDLVTVEIGDSDLIGAGMTTATFAASSRTNRTTVTLFETTHPGLFRGYVTLVAGVAGTNQLRVQHGDTLVCTNFDASNNSNAVARATVDTQSPVISLVASMTDYANALISWRTTEPSDSAVQYSEQPLPAQTVYSSQLTTNHALTVSGLAANRTYYFQVASRDAAGNTTVDDNGGNLYSFTTLKAPTPPWIRDLESGTNNWSVFADSGSDVNWRLGTPNNALATSAHSGTNVWGCSLTGEQPALVASSFLCSPTIDLSGLTSATLTFSNAYDFTELFFGFPAESGTIFIRTNLSATPTTSLPMAGDFAGDAVAAWGPISVSLTPWVGKTIQVVFYYQGVSFGNPIKGWLIDDISITGVSAGGNISITKNLGQGTWSLARISNLGDVPVQSGVAPAITISNLPAGNYHVQFGDVPDYLTPPDQTNTLALSGALSFTGTYEIIDVNSNGIADSWERNFFNTVSTNRTVKTDSDGDGMTDYAEFIAGTNPTNAASKLIFTAALAQTNHNVRLQWSAVADRLYRLLSATGNFTNWSAYSDWQQATTNQVIFTATNATTSARFFRVQVSP
jgi:hypothetical protein